MTDTSFPYLAAAETYMRDKGLFFNHEAKEVGSFRRYYHYGDGTDVFADHSATITSVKGSSEYIVSDFGRKPQPEVRTNSPIPDSGTPAPAPQHWNTPAAVGDSLKAYSRLLSEATAHGVAQSLANRRTIHIDLRLETYGVSVNVRSQYLPENYSIQQVVAWAELETYLARSFTTSTQTENPIITRIIRCTKLITDEIREQLASVTKKLSL